MKLEIEFARRSAFQSTGVRLMAVSMLFVLLAYGSFAALELKNRSLSDQLTIRREAIKAAQPAIPARPVIDAAEQQRIRRASLELSVEWGRLLHNVESAHFDAITLMDIESEAPGSSLRVSGTARSYSDVLAFIERLSNRDMIYDVLLASHQSVSGSTDSPIKFVITARWRVR